MNLTEGRRIIVSQTDFFRVLDSVVVSKITIPNKDQNGFKRFIRYKLALSYIFHSTMMKFYEVFFSVFAYNAGAFLKIAFNQPVNVARSIVSRITITIDHNAGFDSVPGPNSCRWAITRLPTLTAIHRGNASNQ